MWDAVGARFSQYPGRRHAEYAASDVSVDELLFLALGHELGDATREVLERKRRHRVDAHSSSPQISAVSAFRGAEKSGACGAVSPVVDAGRAAGSLSSV